MRAAECERRRYATERADLKAEVSSLRREVARHEAATLAREKAAVCAARHQTIEVRRKEAADRKEAALVLQQMQTAAAHASHGESGSLSLCDGGGPEATTVHSVISQGHLRYPPSTE